MIFWLRAVCFDWTIIIIGYIFIIYFDNYLIKFLSLIMIGSRQHALAILGHDGAHRLICNHRLLNDLLTYLFCFFPLGIHLFSYRKFHFNHHKNVGTPNDPELIHKHNRYLNQWKTPINIKNQIFCFLFDFLGGAIPHICFLFYLIRPNSLLKVLPLYSTFVSVIALLVYFNMTWIPFVWFLSLTTSFWFVFRLRVWTEHVRTESTHIIKANLLERFLFLPHNTYYHYEHHKNPNVPFWKLPELREYNSNEISIYKLFKKFL